MTPDPATSRPGVGTTTATAPARRGPGAAVGVLRLLGAALLLGLAGIHLYLWQAGYDGIAVIGPAGRVVGCRSPSRRAQDDRPCRTRVTLGDVPAILGVPVSELLLSLVAEAVGAAVVALLMAALRRMLAAARA
jgi:hypothetical protein